MAKPLRRESPAVIRKLIVSYLFAATLEYLLLPAPLKDLSGLAGVAAMSLPRMLGIWAVGFLLLMTLERYIPQQLERWALGVLLAVLGGVSWAANRSLPYLVAVLLTVGLASVYAVFGWNAAAPAPAPDREKSRLFALLALGLGLCFFAFVAAWTVTRVLVYFTPSFDFGIFSQMFYNMRRSGVPETTLERQRLLSHFKVHVSPIYYLMLPIYWIFPYPATLQILQAAVMASAAIPLWLLAKQRGLAPAARLAFCAALLLYPAYSSAASYDLHENCFLTPLLFWLFYALERKNIPLTALFTVLTLCVKEDAAVYTMAAGVWVLLCGILRPKDRLRQICTAVFMIAVSAGWFLGVTAYLASKGDGVMAYRYENFMYDGKKSLLSAVVCVILCPAKALFECVDQEKLQFISLTLLPLLGFPLLTRRYERLILLVPWVLLNLLSDYQYQHDIFFQYTFGSVAFLFFLSLLNFSDLTAKIKKAPKAAAALLLLPVVVLCAVDFVEYPLPEAQGIFEVRRHFREDQQAVAEILRGVEEEASVASTTFYTTALSSRRELYDVKYASEQRIFHADVIVIDRRYVSDFQRWATDAGRTNGLDHFRRRLGYFGYVLEAEYGGRVEVWRKRQT